MSDEVARAHQEVATRNSREAIRKADATRNELLGRITHLEALVANLTASVAQLEQKYNLLLTARFDGRATSS
jgi:hypothetical protein